MDSDPFEVLRAYNARSVWEGVRRRGVDPAVVERALQDIPEVSPIAALKAGKEVVDLIVRQRWMAMRDAREKGSSWSEIGDALGMGEVEAQEWYLEKIELQERYVADLHDAPRARAVIDTPPGAEL